MKKLFIIIFGLFIVNLNSQSNSKLPSTSSNIAPFFDDGGIMSRKNQIRFNFFNIITTSIISAGYERKLGRLLSLEAGGKIKVIPEGSLLLGNNREDKGKILPMFAYFIRPRVYISGKYINRGFYIGGNFEQGNGKYVYEYRDLFYNQVKDKINYSYVYKAGLLGCHIQIRRKISIYADTYGGVLEEKYLRKGIDKEEDKSELRFRIEIGFGYLF